MPFDMSSALSLEDINDVTSYTPFDRYLVSASKDNSITYYHQFLSEEYISTLIILSNSKRYMLFKFIDMFKLDICTEECYYVWQVDEKNNMIEDGSYKKLDNVKDIESFLKNEIENK